MRKRTIKAAGVDSDFDTGASGINDAVMVITVATDGSGDVYVVGDFTLYHLTPAALDIWT